MTNPTPPKEKFRLSATRDGLTATAYRGVGSVMFAFSFAEKPADNFAGFAIRRTPPKGKPYYLPNRLNFATGITAATSPEKRTWTGSNEAPFQKFRWADFPKVILPGTYEYDITPMYFKPNGKLQKGTAVPLEFKMAPENFGNFEMGFTRAYISSQAYAEQFKNAAIRPKGKKTFDYDTAPYHKQYEWLGFHARRLVFDFLNEALNDPTITLDVFAYDLDEPDVIRLLAKFGPRLRLYLDNASLHTSENAVEPLVQALLAGTAGNDNVKVGHFRRFSHSKVFIQKKNGVATKVLTGSANFSVRGLYVQANNILVFNDSSIAGLYEQAFEQAFTNPSKFGAAEIASKWHEIKVANCPECLVAFSPHGDPDVSLKRVTDEVKKADHSVLFAIMELGGGGSVLDEIRKLSDRSVFSFGVTQTAGDLKVFKPGSTKAQFLPFAYLTDKMPKNFQKEWSGGAGQVVHHKFIVVDFNDSDPVLFTGSSNLSSGGEKANGDNLLAIYDRDIATAYAVEAIRLLDHYQFRAAMKNATKDDPLKLQAGGEVKKKRKWFESCYEDGHIKQQDRLLFSKPVKP